MVATSDISLCEQIIILCLYSAQEKIDYLFRDDNAPWQVAAINIAYYDRQRDPSHYLKKIGVR